MNSQTFRRPSGPAGSRVATAVLAALALMLAAPAEKPAKAAQEPVFRTAIDLIAVDVQVMDRRGEPVVTMSPDQFVVTIDGRRRRVISADLAHYDVANPGAAVPASNTSPHPISPNGPTGDGRTFIVAIDTASFRGLDVQLARLAAARFVDHLLPDDAVGLFPLPHGPFLEPTTSHATVRAAMEKVVGRKTAGSAVATMSIEQMVDVTAAANTLPILGARTVVGEMISDNAADSMGAEQPIDCPGTKVACTEQVIAEASALANAVEDDVFQGIMGLDALLRRLQATPERKTVILLSAGMPTADRSGGRPGQSREVRLIGERAAYANATIHTVYFDTDAVSEFSVDARKPRSSSGRTRVINTRALVEVTEPSGGALVEVGPGPAGTEIDRLVRQISTFYVLGVEPEARDRDGRPHRLDVKVPGQDVRLRSRELVIVPRSN